MAGFAQLSEQSISRPNQFNWWWFVEVCVASIISLFFLFYFNRLFATLLSYGIRAYSWHHYRVWIDFQALQISLLGGRVFFKGVRYHGENETIFVHSGNITWRYWFRNVRQPDLTTDEKVVDDTDGATSSSNASVAADRTSTDEEQGAFKKQENLQARIAISVTGVEWFIYNRTPMYDAIVNDDANTQIDQESVPALSTGISNSEALKAHIRSKFRKRPKSSDTTSSDNSKMNTSASEKLEYVADNALGAADRRSTMSSEQVSVEEDVSLIQSLLVQTLPVYIECSRAAVSIGNEHTRAILVTTVEKARGHVDARGCGPHDVFRQIFEFDVEHPVIQMRPNPDFVGTQMSVAEHIITDSDATSTKKRWWKWNLNLQQRRHNALDAIRNLVPGLQSSVESLHHSNRRSGGRASYKHFADTDPDGEEWHGLSRYMDENDADDHQAWAHIDYARFSTILDCPSVHMTFYWDSPGRVKAEHLEMGKAAKSEDINGVRPPAYGLDLTVRGGNVDYGPWADRLRAELQSVFFPASYRSSEPAKTLEAGQWRQFTTMTIRVDIEEEITMRVPMRESSKDWRWRGRATAVRDAAAIRAQRQKRHFRLRKGPKASMGPDIRPFGWISFSVAPDSSVRYDMDMVAGRNGYQNKLQLDLKHTKAMSSVNHADLWRCVNQKLHCDLSNPLGWNSLHTWHFDIENKGMDMYLLRDHMFLLTDLIADFTAGLKSSYMTFVPFEYKIGLKFEELKLFLNANDYNIIDNPCDLDSNAFLTLGMHRLDGNVDIPMKYFSASQSSVHFKAQGSDLSLDLKTPAWNTLRSFAKDDNMATLKRLGLSGSYNYNAGTTAQLTDSLFMDIVGGSPKFNLQGFLIRYFMNVKENYFGEDLHFRTLEEYQSRLGPDNRLLPEEPRRIANKDNDLDVVLNVRAEESCSLMPANIYVREECLRVDVMLVEADMRFTNYYMDLQVNSSPIEVSIEREDARKGKTGKDTTACQLYISTVSVYGHRLFGAPPTEPTYVCNWDFDVGSIYGECSSQFIRVLNAAIQAFIFTLDDHENALPVAREAVLNDITFLRARTGSLQIWVATDMAAFLVKTGDGMVSFDDWAGQHFSKSLKAYVPAVTIAAIEHRGSVRRQNKAEQQRSTLACIQTSVQIVNIDKKAHFEYQRQLQQEHVKFHDLRTGRASCLLRDDKPLNISAKDTHWSQDPPAMPIPDLPFPIPTQDELDQRRTGADSLHHRLRQNSFFSSSSGIAPEKGTPESKDSPERQKMRDFDFMKPPDDSSGVRSYGSPKHFENNANSEHDPSMKDTNYSSPWIEPQFSLRGICPDMSQMPPLPSDFESSNFRTIRDRDAEQEYVDSDESLPHAAVYCDVPTGIRGFCSPQLFPTIVDMLKNLVPQDPHSILDIVQYSTMTNIKNWTTESVGEKIDFAVRIPFAAIRLVDTAPTFEERTPDLLGDQYEFAFSRGRLNGRIAPTFTRHRRGQTKRNILLLQASIQGVNVSVAERLSSTRQAAQVQASMKDLEFWLSLQDEIKSKSQLGSLEISTGGSTVDRLSMLTERSRVMITNIVEGFENMDQAYAIRHMIYHLCLLNSVTTYPTFLNRPSYVLRGAAEHIRLAESWKILTRFRQMLVDQSPQEKADLMSHGSCLFEKQEDKAQQQILETIDTWETWDQNHEAYRPFLAAVFGHIKDTGSIMPIVLDLEIGVYLGQISVVLDPGPQQSELLLQSGDLNILQKPSFEQGVEGAPQNFSGRSKVRVQVWFAEAGLDLNWNLIELARSLVKQFNLSKVVGQAAPKQQEVTPEPTSNQLDLMVVAGTDTATTKIRTINLNMYMAARSLQTSTVVQLFDTSSTMSSLMTATSAQLKVASQRAKLFTWKLHGLSLYGLYQQNQRNLSGSDTARFAASCDRLRFDMKEDVLSVLQLTDSVIKDEVTAIQEVINGIEKRTAAVRRNSQTSSLKLEDIHVAFFLNNYKLQFCFLPSLHYGISGMVARTSLVPRGNSTYAVHIDVKKNKHILVEPSGDRHGSAATLEIPPISGRLVIGFTKEQIIIRARSTLERVAIEARAVQACIEAAYQPRNIECLKQCKTVIGRIQSSAEAIERSSVRRQSIPQSENESKKVLLYWGLAVFEGLDIHCSAPATGTKDYQADFRLGLRETTLRIHNHHKLKKVPLDQPQFEINLRQVFAGLYQRNNDYLHNYGKFVMGLRLKGTTHIGQNGEKTQNYELQSQSTRLDLFEESAALVIDMATWLQHRIAKLTTIEDRKKIQPLRRLTLANNESKFILTNDKGEVSSPTASSNVFDSTFALDLNLIQVRWIVAEESQIKHSRVPEDLVFSIRQIDLRTQRESSARLMILDLQLQTVPKKQDNPTIRTANSALMPEVIFNAAHFSTKKDRRFAFQAAGKALDLRLAADGILPLSSIQKSLARATADLRSADMVQVASNSEQSSTKPVTSFLGNKILASLLVDADFAGAVVRITPRADGGDRSTSAMSGPTKGSKKAGRYGQAVQSDGVEQAILRAPGIAVKVEYIDTSNAEPTLSTEIKVAASSNTLAPSVVPLALEIYSSIKEIIGEDGPKDGKPDIRTPAQKYLGDAAITETDPTAILGRVKLNAGLWVQRQEFSLTCQPIARVAATAMFEEIFVTINTIQDGDQERFFSIITTFNRLQTSVQHVYSRESTASFEVESIVISLMNSKHISDRNGISAILNISPMRATLNAKQMQDFLLFREIWYPAELRQRSKPSTPVSTANDSQGYAMQKYHELAATAALPWHAIVSIHELKLEVDFGQSLGKSSFMISKLWASSKKSSDWEQNLCIGFDSIGVDSSGRMSGFIELKDLRARTSIRWPVAKDSGVRAPLVQASVGFGYLRLKTAFDYQPFAVADVSTFEFLMYNVRPTEEGENDRLVGILNGGKVQVFCISAAAGQALSIVQALERLFQEKRDAFQESLRELDKLLRRRGRMASTATSTTDLTVEPERRTNDAGYESHRLHTDVVVTLKVVDLGVFPNTFFDTQILKLEAMDVRARFAVATVENKLSSGLGMTLGEVRVALSSVNRANTKALGEVEIGEVIERATTSRGGTILKVPRLVASMQTWQAQHSNKVEYIFRSTFQGKVDVGWNFSRIRFIRNMWEIHSQALAHRLGKPLPPAAVKITAEPQGYGTQGPGQEKITAVVNVPQSTKFNYIALEPPIIDTPQLRDMGEATPPLEWIGLHRDKLPNVTHSIVIVTLLEVAKEVEDAYTKILGTG